MATTKECDRSPPRSPSFLSLSPTLFSPGAPSAGKARGPSRDPGRATPSFRSAHRHRAPHDAREDQAGKTSNNRKNTHTHIREVHVICCIVVYVFIPLYKTRRLVDVDTCTYTYIDTGAGIFLGEGIGDEGADQRQHARTRAKTKHARYTK